MDADTEARRIAVELLLANIIAEGLRQAPDPVETASEALRSMLRQASERVYVGTLDRQDMLQVRVGDAVAEVMRVALARVTGI